MNFVEDNVIYILIGIGAQLRCVIEVIYTV